MREQPKRKILFHIGLEKTGTTSFQSFCTRNRSELLRHSVLYPTENFGFSKDNHSPLVASYFPGDAAGPLLMRSSHRDKETVLRSLECEIESSLAETVLVSAEHFSSRFNGAHIEHLAADFAGYDCRIAVVLRDHVSRAMSAYYTTIASGRHLSLEDFIDELCQPHNVYIRYKDLVSQWESAFGRDNIIVIPYVENENIIGSLARTLISPEARLDGISAYARNKSPGASAIEAMRRTNEDLADRRHSGQAERFAYWLAGIRNAIRKKTTKAPGDRLRLGENAHRRLNAIAESDRLWLEERYGVYLPQAPAR